MTARIVVGVDGSKASDLALAWAADEARRRKVELRVVHAWHMPYADGFPLGPAPVDPTLIEDGARQVLSNAVEHADTSGIPVVDKRLVSGGAAAALLAESEDADLVVVGARGLGGFAGLLLGSVSAQVVHHAACPVVVVPAHR